MSPHHLVQKGLLPTSVSLPQLLHVAIVCAGHNTSRDVVTLVKSMLFYRYSQVLRVGCQEWGTEQNLEQHEVGVSTSEPLGVGLVPCCSFWALPAFLPLSLPKEKPTAPPLGD